MSAPQYKPVTCVKRHPLTFLVNVQEPDGSLVDVCPACCPGLVLVNVVKQLFVRKPKEKTS